MVIQGKARRYVLGLLVALLIGLFVREAVAQVIATPPACKTATPSDWEYYQYMCWNYPSAAPLRGILVR
jgi:hypothetical protein